MNNKILVISHSCILSVNRHVYRNLINNGWDVSIIVPDNREIENEHQSKLKIIKSKFYFNKNRLWLIKNLKKKLLKIKPNYILVDNEPFSFLTAQLIFLKKYFNYKIINFSLDHHYYNNSLIFFLSKLILFTPFAFFINKNIDHIFCYSSLIKNFNSKFIVKKKLSIIPLGYPDKLFYPNNLFSIEIRNNLQINKNIFLIGYFGRISKEKGVYELLICLQKLLHHDWILILDSFEATSSYHSKVLNYIDKNNELKQRIIYIHSKHQDIPKYINSCDLIIMPSKWEEQYGRIAAESMACGKLVVASESQSLKDIISTYGYIFKKNNYEELTNIINDILQNNKNNINYKNISDYAYQNLSANKQSNDINQKLKEI